MLNANFKNMNKATRRDKLCSIICSKAKDISDENLARILDAVDIEKQYTVTGTTDINILLRNAFVEDGGDVFQVSIAPVYGSLKPGFVAQDGETIQPEAEDIPTAFVKTVVIADGEHQHRQNSIFIYQKRNTVVA